MSSTRTASHAGSWYTDNGNELNRQLSQWLTFATDSNSSDGLRESPVKGCKAIIAPHAGYSYSGPAAAYAYGCIDIEPIKRVFILGPSHHVYLDGCALSRCKTYATPVGDLPLDLDTIAELSKTGGFEWMDNETDEDEHSIEMHLPYIRKVFEGRDISIVPILVGSITTSQERHFGSLLAPYLSSPSTLFVVSSDFCHWGTRFRYTRYQPFDSNDLREGVSLTSDNWRQVVSEMKQGGGGGAEIWKGIEKLDRLGMETIQFGQHHRDNDVEEDREEQEESSTTTKSASEAHSQFSQYLRQTKNTICGRHPIGVLLGALSVIEGLAERGEDESGNEMKKIELEWTRYEQSSQVKNLKDSSVSYASAFVKFSSVPSQ